MNANTDFNTGTGSSADKRASLNARLNLRPDTTRAILRDCEGHIPERVALKLLTVRYGNRLAEYLYEQSRTDAEKAVLACFRQLFMNHLAEHSFTRADGRSASEKAGTEIITNSPLILAAKDICSSLGQDPLQQKEIIERLHRDGILQYHMRKWLSYFSVSLTEDRLN